MGGKQKKEKRKRAGRGFWGLLSECAMPFAAGALFIGALGAGLYFAVPDIFPLSALAAFPSLLAVTGLSVFLCFAITASSLLLALALSNIELWRAILLFLTFALPSLVLAMRRGYTQRICKMITLFCEESTKLDTTAGVCASAVRFLKNRGFFKNVALLFWNRETDKFKIIAATGAYEVGTEIAGDSTFYMKCHSSLKPAKFTAPHSSLFFLPSKIEAKSAFCVPLHLGGRRFGVIVAESHFSRAWSRGSQQVLLVFAVVLSYVIAEFETREGIKRAVPPAKKGAFPAGKSM